MTKRDSAPGTEIEPEPEGDRLDRIEKERAESDALVAHLSEKFADQSALLDVPGQVSNVSDMQSALTALSSSLTKQFSDIDTRLTKLEAGTGTPPDTTQPPIPDQPPPENTAKRYPDLNDPDVGCPSGLSLTNLGSTTYSKAGEKISNKKFSGRVTINAANIELFNCVIDAGSDWWGVMVNSAGTGFVMHHCTIQSIATNGNSGINTGPGSNIHHCRFNGFENAFNIAGSDNLIEWNESTSLKGSSSSHYDNLQADGGFSNLKIRHNRFECKYGQTSAVMLDNYFGKISDVEVSDNWLGGGGYPCYLDGSFKGSANAVNVVYKNNVVKKGQWGYFYWSNAGSGCAKQGNIDATSGANVDNA